LVLRRRWVWAIAVVAVFLVAGLAYGANHVAGYQLQDKAKQA
jgi:uncharacterized protein involved in exopolysaccharide biosynthesis